jgi:hypothetical protein
MQSPVSDICIKTNGIEIGEIIVDEKFYLYLSFKRFALTAGIYDRYPGIE